MARGTGPQRTDRGDIFGARIWNGRCFDGAPAWGLVPLPAGAVACHGKDGMTDDPEVRMFELGRSPKEGRTAWTDHLEARGWRSTQESADEARFERAGERLTLTCSQHVTDKGWCTIAHAAK